MGIKRMVVDVRSGGSKKVKKPPVEPAVTKKVRKDKPAKPPEPEATETEEGGNE